MKNRREKSTEPARPNPDEVAALAYELWQARGCPAGSPETDWLQAESQLRNDLTTHRLMAA